MRIIGHELHGKYFDKETNTHYNYFRDYDPGIGRYVQADPLGITTTKIPTPTTGLNHLYAYAENEPLRRTDPRGNLSGSGGVAIGASVYGVACLAYAVGRANSLFVGLPDEDKKKHCYVSCIVNRCLLLLVPYVVYWVGVQWEKQGIPDISDIDANVYGIASSITLQWCDTACRSCPVQ